MGAGVTEAAVSVVAWQTFKPDRQDAHLVGICGEQLASVIAPRAGVREVYVSEATTAHYRERHSDHFDLDRAEALLPDVIANPIMVCQAKKPASLVFVGDFDEEHYLIAPVKAVRGEMWLESLFIDRKAKFLKRAWVQIGVLYQKQEGRVRERLAGQV